MPAAQIAQMRPDQRHAVDLERAFRERGRQAPLDGWYELAVLGQMGREHVVAANVDALAAEAFAGARASGKHANCDDYAANW